MAADLHTQAIAGVSGNHQLRASSRGAEYARIADPLRALLKPLADFPPNEKQLQAIEELKELVIEHHHLCVPDEAAAIEAANAWLSGAPPAGRPYETGADTSGYAIGGVCGQCDKDIGKLLPLLYFTTHLAAHQMHWHSFEQELWGLLNVKGEEQAVRADPVHQPYRSRELSPLGELG